MSAEEDPVSAEGSGEAKSASEMPLPGGDFRLFVTKLSIQGLFALGLIENPITKKTEVNLGHAQTLIDDLLMLREKTQGNLGQDEAAHLNKVISDLQWQFVERSKASAGSS